MIHKIHSAAELPSVVDGEPGATYAIFSSFGQEDVVFSEKLTDGTVEGIRFPRPLNDCLTCHTDGPTAAHYMDSPSTAACTSCHDDVNPSLEETDAGSPGTNHFSGRSFADGDCTFCHTTEGVEFDISVAGAHTIPERSAQLEGLVVEIASLSSHNAGQAPTVRFRVTNDAGTPLTNLSDLNRVGFTLSGPTEDYAEVFTATAVGGGSAGTLVGPDGEGFFDYTLPVSVPAAAEGTWAIGAEARRSVQLQRPEGGPISVNEAAVNPVVTFSVDGSMPMARRMVAEDGRCQACHGEFSRGFSIHGNLRNRIEYCVMCHNPNETDYARRMRDPEAVAAGDLNATIDFKVLIHKIHTGEELAQHPYEVYGFGPAPANFTVHDFSHVLYPGDRRNCSTCHADDSNLLPPFPGTALGTLITAIDPSSAEEVVLGGLGPITAACTSCHDSDAAMAHADTQTDGSGREACLVCHQEGRDVPVSEAHAR
jgi:OmcA/MtrC family decaheme c-type cytochrome